MNKFTNGEKVYLKDGTDFIKGTYTGRYWFFGWVNYIEVSRNCFQERDYDTVLLHRRTSSILRESELPADPSVVVPQVSFAEACNNHPSGCGRHAGE